MRARGRTCRLWGLSLGVGMAVLGCGAGSSSEAPTTRSEVELGPFVDRTTELGVDFVHDDGRSGQRYYPETVASGGGWIDFDHDGDPDLYLLDGAATPGSPPRERRNVLYENRDGSFVDVTSSSGLGDEGYGMGFCAADFDGDGWVDLYVTNYGPDRLFRNLGDGAAPRFVDVATESGIVDDGWSTNCAFVDVDGDLDLDLYVVRYVAFDYEQNPRCGDPARQIWSYCRPLVFAGQRDLLYVNQGPDASGTTRFVEEGVERGIADGTEDRGFGVVATDLTGDGRAELLVANDGSANRLYVNDGTGQFEDQATFAGFAYDGDGRAQSGMGLDVGDVDGDGDADLFVTNYSFETNVLYEQVDGLYFEDRASEAGIAGPSYSPVGWGVRLFDADNDGDLDLAVVNGHVMDNIAEFETMTYPQANQLFLNDGNGDFHESVDLSGTPTRVSRGLATADWDSDGAVDLLVTNTNDRPDLLQNRLASGHWLGVALRGQPPNRSAIGTRVQLLRDGEVWQTREVRSGGSLMSQSDLRLHFGLGTETGVELEIHWPRGVRQRVRVAEVDRYVTVEETD